jgi:hypothetical protein
LEISPADAIATATRPKYKQNVFESPWFFIYKPTITHPKIKLSFSTNLTTVSEDNNGHLEAGSTAKG